MARRFNGLRNSGLSTEEAWKVIAVETLVDVGLLTPETLERPRVSSDQEQGKMPVMEAKFVKVIRIEPAEDDRIKRLVALGRGEAMLSKGDDPSQSSIIRQALRLGLDELERRNARN